MNFLKWFFCIYWDSHVIFIFFAINIMNLKFEYWANLASLGKIIFRQNIFLKYCCILFLNIWCQGYAELINQVGIFFLFPMLWKILCDIGSNFSLNVWKAVTTEDIRVWRDFLFLSWLFEGLGRMRNFQILYLIFS